MQRPWYRLPTCPSRKARDVRRPAPSGSRTLTKREFRRALLARPTPAERLFASLLDANNIAYARQPIIQGYIPDFRLAAGRILIEIDGAIHDTPEHQAADAERTAHLAAKGWRLLRFRNATVAQSPTAVLRAVRRALREAPTR